MPEVVDVDVLVIGCGAAGLSTALELSAGGRIAVVSKGPLGEGATLYAQGGIAAVSDPADSVESHVADTLAAGAGLCDGEVVRFVVERAPGCIEWLNAQGVEFSTEPVAGGTARLHLAREGGHSHRRVVHAADETGRAVEMALLARLRAFEQIITLENHVAVDLITARKLGHREERCLGAYVFDKQRGTVATVRARVVVLASGGAGKVYLYTSNPDSATGDGIAMAWRAGCEVADMEFFQFHPTCLYHPAAKSFLITEALRGEGAKLLLPDGTAFMHRFDPRAELAPRDIVARAIDHEIKRLGADCVYLDISHRPENFIKSHFPTVHSRCLSFGIDITTEPIPVVPAAHYLCGGVVTDRFGRTSLPGLYAVGEVARTGLHGANRVASNSLLECVVIARSAAADIARRLPGFGAPPQVPAWDESQVTDSDEEVVVSHNWEELRRFMWDYVGIVRTTKRLQRALNRIALLRAEIAEYYGNFRVTNDLLELRNLVQVAELIVRSALARRESRGLHYTLDYPQLDTAQPPRSTILKPPLPG
jgi:L-aspartate oxidase